MSHTKSLTAALAAMAAIFPICATANSITGGIHFTGDVTLTTDIDPSSPDYGDGLLTFNPQPSPNTAYTFNVDNASGSLSSLEGVYGNEATLGAAAEPIDTPLDVADFLTFAGSSTTFTLTYVYAGVDSAAGCSDVVADEANGNLCSPAGTPFNLEDIAPNGTNSQASFVVSGDIVSGGVGTPAIITFSAASTGKSFEQILNDQENGIADVITYGAQLNVVPEPRADFLMLGACLMLAGTIFRRKKTQ